jgi:hypothetical protein
MTNVNHFTVRSARWKYPFEKKMVLCQLTSEKYKWIIECYWKKENVSEVQRRWIINLEFGTGGGHFEHCEFKCITGLLQLCLYTYVVMSIQSVYTFFRQSVLIYSRPDSSVSKVDVFELENSEGGNKAVAV